MANDPTAIEPFLGAWTNTETASEWIREFELYRVGSVLRMRPRGAGLLRDWGELGVDSFVFKAGESAFCARFERDAMRADLTAYTNKGLIVIAAYLAFRGEPEKNVLCREFFVPKPSAPAIPKPVNRGLANAMLADTLPLAEDAGDVNGLTGSWVNTMPNADAIARVEIDRDPAGGFYLRTWGAASPHPFDWGRIPMEAHVSGRNQTGFHAVYDLGEASIALAANAKLGVLVIQSFTSFTDGSGRAPYIRRDFFQREPARVAEAVIPRRTSSKPAPADLTGFLGSWENTSASPEFIEGFSLSKRGEHWSLEGRTAKSELEAIEVTAYMDNMGYQAFLGRHTLDGSPLLLAANTQKELIVLTSFQRARAGEDHRNLVMREFFFRAPDGGPS